MADLVSPTYQVPAFARLLPGSTCTVFESPPDPRTIWKSMGIDFFVTGSTPLYWFQVAGTCPNQAAGGGSPTKLTFTVTSMRCGCISHE